MMKKKTNNVFDLIILLAKQYIYRAKVNSIKPSFVAFRRSLAFRFQVEKEISYLHAENTQFEKDWLPYTNFIEYLKRP